MVVANEFHDFLHGSFRFTDFIQTKKYPSWTPVHRIVEGAETAPFKQFFATWRDSGMQHTRLIRAANDNDSDSGLEEEIDTNELRALKKSGGRALGFMPDNGEGAVDVWRIVGKDPVAVDPISQGFFYGSSCYVMKYHYENKRGGEGYVIYYWQVRWCRRRTRRSLADRLIVSPFLFALQGKNASKADKAASASYAAELDKETGNTAIEVRIVQDHEPRHFLKIFKGKLLTYLHDDSADATNLFRIRGTCAEDVRAGELPPLASSLASDDVFILKSANVVYVWKGIVSIWTRQPTQPEITQNSDFRIDPQGGSDFEKEMAAVVVNTIAPEGQAEVIDEGSEPDQFWELLNGKADYDTELDAPGAPCLEPRLFHCKLLNNGKVRVEEIGDFEQADMDADDIMILDGGDEVYVWEGAGSTPEEKEKSLEVANVRNLNEISV